MKKTSECMLGPTTKVILLDGEEETLQEPDELMAGPIGFSWRASSKPPKSRGDEKPARVQRLAK